MPESSRPISGPDCLELNDLLEAFADGDLEPAVCSKIESHLAGCAACRAELELVRSVSIELQRLPSLTCPDELVTRVLDAKTSEPASLGVAATSSIDGHAEDHAHAEDHGGDVVSWPSHSAWSRPLLQAAAIVVLVGAAAFSGYWFLGGNAELPGGQPQAHATYSQAELEQAQADLEVALAYFGGLAQKAGLVLRDDVVVGRVFEPTRSALSRVAMPGRESLQVNTP